MADTYTTPVTQPRTGLGLATISDQGAAPRPRLDSFTHALGLVENMRKASEARNLKAARFKGQLDGNPPFNPDKLRTNGMAYYPNFNTLEAKAYLSSALVPYYDLFSSAPQHLEVTLDRADQAEREDWSRVATEECHRLLSDSRWFEDNVWKTLHDYVGFGKGFWVWPDPVTWRFRHVPWHRVWFPDNTDVDMDTWEYFAIRWDYDAHDLYRRIRNSERASASGWQTDNVIKAIRSAAKYTPASFNDWVAIQQQLKDHDLYADSRCERIITAWLFVKEFDGKWSWYVLPLTNQATSQTTPVTGTATAGDPAAGFLYRRIGLYGHPSQILAPFFFEVFDGSINGLSGLMKDIFAPMQLKDRMACAKVNNVFMRSSILMQAQTGSGRQKAALAQINNVCVIPEGYAVQQSTILGDIESTIAVGRDIDLMLQANTGIYRPQFEKPQGNPETATAATLRFQQGTILGNSAVNRFHRQLDGGYAELYRRLAKSSEEEAKQFRQWCKDRGVPVEALVKTRKVSSYRNIGNGSAFLRQNNIASLAAFFPEFPEDGKQAFLADVVSAYTGQQKVDRYVRTDRTRGIPDRHIWEATTENDSLANGRPAQWTPQQDDMAHLAIHSGAVDQALASVQQGADPSAVAVFGQAALAHGAEHIAALQRKGRKAQVTAWSRVYGDLAKTVNELTRQVQAGQRDAAQRQQHASDMVSDQQLDAAELSGKMQLAGLKTQHQMMLRQKAADQKLAINDLTAASDIRRSNLEAAADQRRKNLTAGGNGAE